MTRVLRQYSKSQLEAIVVHATRKESAARAAHTHLRARYRSSLAIATAVAFSLGILTAWWFLR